MRMSSPARSEDGGKRSDISKSGVSISKLEEAEKEEWNGGGERNRQERDTQT